MALDPFWPDQGKSRFGSKQGFFTFNDRSRPLTLRFPQNKVHMQSPELLDLIIVYSNYF